MKRLWKLKNHLHIILARLLMKLWNFPFPINFSSHRIFDKISENQIKLLAPTAYQQKYKKNSKLTLRTIKWYINVSFSKGIFSHISHIYQILLLLHGDVGLVNSGPNKKYKPFTCYHWNVNGLTAHKQLITWWNCLQLQLIILFINMILLV